MESGRWYVIGAAADCDVVVDAAPVSGRHAYLARSGTGYAIRDAGSRNGIFVRGERVEEGQVEAGDEIGLGSHRMRVDELVRQIDGKGAAGPKRPTPVQAPQSGRANVVARELLVGEEPIVIGREDGLGVTLNEGGVSARHARVFRSGGRTIVEDLGSRNGTFVRHGGTGEWVNYRTCVLRRGDQIRIGGAVFEPKPTAVESHPGARLDVRDLQLTVTHRATGAPLNLLAGVSFTALDGEVVGILGPSGSGKTSLLNVLAGFDAPTAGEVLLQGQPLHAAGAVRPELGALVGHAPQFDVAHEHLTVREAIRASAQLRGDANWSAAEIEQRVQQAIAAVDLVAKAETQLGSETRKTLSGGQKKRVNIAMELVLDPPILLLDEPTSGLSAQDTMDLMRLLRRLAAQGRTIILTIHQPSYAAFVQMDQILVLEEGGHVAYFGPAAVDSFDYFGITDREPGALLEALPRKQSPEAPGVWSQRFEHSDVSERFVRGRRAALDSQRPSPWPSLQQPGGLTQLGTLLGRNLRLKFRDPFFLMLSFVVPPVVAALFVAVLGARVGPGDAGTHVAAQVAHQYLVVLTIMTCFFGALAASLEVVPELAILRRERRGGVSLGAYVGSKALTYLVPAVFFPALALGAIHGLDGDVLGGTFVQQWAVLASAFFASATAGLLFSSALASAQSVIVVAVFYAIVQVVFSVFVPLHITHGPDKRSGWLAAASVPMTARWTLGGLVSVRDLCDVEDDTSDETTLADKAATAAQNRLFQRDCRRGFYQDHGILEAGSADDRKASEHRTHALASNGALALLALFGMAVALQGRSRGTQG